MRKITANIANKMLKNSNLKTSSGIKDGFLVLNFNDITIDDVKKRYDIKGYDAKLYLCGGISIVFRMEEE